MESAYLLICLDPDGNVQGSVMLETKDSDNEQQFLLIEGKWEASNPSLFFTDTRVMYEGTVFAAAFPQKAFRFVGKTTPLEDSFSSSSFEYPQLTPPPPPYHFLLRSGLLEMEGNIVGANGKNHRSKALLSLNKDSGLRGWLSIEKSPRSICVGNVLSGGWELSGGMHLTLYFPRSENEPLDRPSSPSNFLAEYKLDGNLKVKDSAGNQQGSTTLEGTWRMAGLGEDAALDTTHLKKIVTGLESFGKYNYDCFRTPSRRLPTPFQNAIKLLRLPSEPGHAQRLHTFCQSCLSQAVS